MPTDQEITLAIKDCLEKGECKLLMGHADQGEMDRTRGRLLKACSAPWPNVDASPIEILTLPGSRFGEVGFLLRRYVVPPLGTCAGHRCMPSVSINQPHTRYYDCQDWVKV